MWFWKTNACYTADHPALDKHIVEGPQLLPLVRSVDQIDVSTDAAGWTVTWETAKQRSEDYEGGQKETRRPADKC